MKTSNVLLLAALALILVGITALLTTFKVNMLDNCIEANGSIIEKEVKTEPYKSINISSKLNVEITQDTVQKVVIEAEENLVDNFSVVVRDEQLKVSRIYCMKKSHNVLIKISVDTLEQLKVQSGGNVKTTNEIKGDRFEMDVNSGAEVNMKLSYGSVVCNLSAGAIGILEGYADKLRADINAGSMLRAKNLTVKNCDLSANSGAMAEVKATDELTINANTGANVQYHGEPLKKNFDAATGGNINQISE